jgi:hypothetical protein
MKVKGPQPKPEPTPKKAKKPLKRTPIRKKKEVDAELWKWFSIFIRLRDSNDDGICKCCTCGKFAFWKGGIMQAGHGVSRNHWGVKYNERNVSAQCSECNAKHIGGGRQAEYAQFVNKKYGPDAWDILQASRDGKKYTAVECHLLAGHYRKEAIKLSKLKGLEI